jgi:hypothetical protein
VFTTNFLLPGWFKLRLYDISACPVLLSIKIYTLDIALMCFTNVVLPIQNR